MHIMLHEYARGERGAIEVSDDGTKLLRELEGTMQENEPVCAFIETACESTEQGYDHLLAAIAWLTEEINKRKAAQTRVSA
jgi:hypothetical protein